MWSSYETSSDKKSNIYKLNSEHSSNLSFGHLFRVKREYKDNALHMYIIDSTADSVFILLEDESCKWYTKKYILETFLIIEKLC